MEMDEIDLPEELMLNLKNHRPGHLNDLLEGTWHVKNLEELILAAFGRYISSTFLGFYNGNEIACFEVALCLAKIHLKYLRSPGGKQDRLPTFNLRFIKCVLDSKTLLLLSFFSEAMMQHFNLFLDRSCLFASLLENPTAELTECMRMVMPNKIEAKHKRLMGREHFGLVIYFKYLNVRFIQIQQFLEESDLSTTTTTTRYHHHYFLKIRKSNNPKIRSSILLESAIQTNEFECFENVSSVSLSRKAWTRVFDSLSTRSSQA